MVYPIRGCHMWLIVASQLIDEQCYRHNSLHIKFYMLNWSQIIIIILTRTHHWHFFIIYHYQFATSHSCAICCAPNLLVIWLWFIWFGRNFVKQWYGANWKVEWHHTPFIFMFFLNFLSHFLTYQTSSIVNSHYKQLTITLPDQLN